MTTAQRIVCWALAALVGVYLAMGALPKEGKPEGVDWGLLGSIPVSADGRTKPLDTFSRASLMVLSGRQSLGVDGAEWPATRWALELMSNPEAAMGRKVFRVDHPDVRATLHLEGSPRDRFSFNDLMPRLGELDDQAQRAKVVQPKQRDPVQRAFLDLYSKVSLFVAIGRLEAPYAVAPLGSGEEWKPLAAELDDPSGHAHGQSEAGATWMRILAALRLEKAEDANREAIAYRSRLGTAQAGASDRAAREVVFNRAEPFVRASGGYVVALLVGIASYLAGALGGRGPGSWGEALRRASTWIVLVVFAVHTLGIVARIYLQGRPPVTNLYSSAVFIGWACVPLALMVERTLRVGLGSIVGSAIGFATLVIAHNLSTGGDTMEVMQAVLDSNFWLATHVVVVTIGYSATFLAGFLGIASIVLGVLTPWLRGEMGKRLASATYGVICFATLTSFLGTVLGGIWADQSWGRFWGWDPKENGAALIVLMNLVILHARWGGMVQARGIAVLAVLGNIVTAWSWFGTNMLGVGLHSYGFMDSAVFWILAFALSQVAIMALGLVPLSAWRSVRAARSVERVVVSPTTA